MNLEEVNVVLVDEARTHNGEAGWTSNIIDSAEPGSPSYEFRNV